MLGQNKVLIADDNVRNITILRMILGRGYVLATAASGEEVLTIAPAFRPDLILLDVMMPGIDGYETCRRLRATSTLRTAKIIIVSARAMVSERLQGYEAGADDYVTKPFDADELLAKVRVHLRLKSIEEVDALKTSFLSVLQHETRTPLTGILGAAELLATDETMEPDARRVFAGTILRSATRLHTLLEKVLTLAELKSGTLGFEVIRADLSDLTREAVTTVLPQAAEKRVTIDTRLPAGAAALMDQKYMRTVVTAILDNAVRFSPPEGTIMVQVARDDRRVRLTVTDVGPGIALDALARVFDEFVAGDATHHVDGLGLSLALARGIVERHDGTLSVESRPGAGTTFTMHLPAAGSTERTVESIGALQ